MAKMTALFLTLLALATSRVAAEEMYNGDEYLAPAVASAAAAMAASFAQYVHYSPTPAPTVAQGPAVNVLAKTKKSATPSATACSYWLDNIKHQGVAAFNDNTNYTVYRNVKNYGAKGDGVTDDSAAIQRAIQDGGRPALTSGQTFTNMPAVVYFPPGTYLLSTAIIQAYYTQLIGNPNCLPTLLPMANFTGFGLIDGDQYGGPGPNGLSINPTNIFYRQVRNFIFDMTPIPAANSFTGIHWPTAQATSIQNCVFKMSDAPGTQHQGVFLEGGSAGFMTDLVFTGGRYGMNVGNQQYTMRNISISNAVTAFSLFFDWGWTMAGTTITNCSVGFDISAVPTDQSDHAFMVIDSTFTNTGVAFNTSFNPANNMPASGGTLILENIKVNKVPTAVLGYASSVLYAGPGTGIIAAYAQGHSYTPNGPNVIHGAINPNPRPASLITGSGAYYTISKPQYADVPVSQFVSARTQGAKGNGVHDDTAPLQRALNSTAAAGQILFVDAGTYLVTKTLYIPPGARIVGESYSVIMSSGAFFNKPNAPKPVVQVGVPGDVGRIEWSDMIVSTQGGNIGQQGAILIEWNLASPSTAPSGMWDVHTRIGGFIGSNFQGATCPITPTSPKTQSSQLNPRCYAAHTSMHITPAAQGVYLENVWQWTADHDIDPNDGGNQITIYTGRGLLVDNTKGPVWLWGTAVEHFALYQYQFIGSSNVFAGQVQTETAYWQPNPNATVPFQNNPYMYDPVFPTAPFTAPDVPGVQIPNADGFGLRSVNSTLFLYGVGLYSFFNNYSTTCSNQGGGEVCQSRIFSVEGTSVTYLYDLHTVGTHEIITLNGKDVAFYGDNLDDFTDNVAVFRTNGP